MQRDASIGIYRFTAVHKTLAAIASTVELVRLKALGVFPAKPFHKSRNPLFNFHLWIVTQNLFRLRNIGKRNRHIAGLKRFAINNGFFTQRIFQQFNQLAQRHRL